MTTFTVSYILGGCPISFTFHTFHASVEHYALAKRSGAKNICTHVNIA